MNPCTLTTDDGSGRRTCGQTPTTRIDLLDEPEVAIDRCVDHGGEAS